MFGNKVLLTWREPRFAVRRRRKEIGRRAWAVGFAKLAGKFALGGLAAGLLLVGALALGRPVAAPDALALVAIFAGAGAALGALAGLTALVDLVFAPQISIREKDILIAAPNAANIAHEEILLCALRPARIGALEYDVLEIKLRDGDELFLEIAPDVPAAAVAAALVARGVEVVEGELLTL